ncbi:MAG: hypothetical protein H8F28_11195 [Fibrella sp.]|nr:hypothetical protein [Armatimonadota bacterium]
MAHTYQAGDSVAIIARDTTPADSKSNLYFPHFANLRGSILKVYGEEASILIDRESLPEAIRTRHTENEVAERKKYSDRLSETARGGLSDKEKNFPLQYTILVALKDVQLDKEGAAKRLSAKDLEAAEAAFLAERSSKKK